MALPKLGYLCLCENPSAEEGRALIRQFVLVREADRMGYDDIWLGEHHHDPIWPTGAATALLAHLAAVTSKARIGAMVLTPALRDAVQLAEDVATIDLLSKGRFELGVASGVAFAKTLSARGIGPAEARLRLRTALARTQDLLAGVPLPRRAKGRGDIVHRISDSAKFPVLCMKIARIRAGSIAALVIAWPSIAATRFSQCTTSSAARSAMRFESPTSTGESANAAV